MQQGHLKKLWLLLHLAHISFQYPYMKGAMQNVTSQNNSQSLYVIGRWREREPGQQGSCEGTREAKCDGSALHG